jgi:hypothetical protein
MCVTEGRREVGSYVCHCEGRREVESSVCHREGKEEGGELCVKILCLVSSSCSIRY